MKTTQTFTDVGFHQVRKHGENADGDVFVSNKHADGEGLVCVLSDGLGSGVKACMLATLTSTMAAHFVRSYSDIRRPAEIIMRALPVCDTRQISYATFTIAFVSTNGKARVIEYDNPECLLLRDGKRVRMDRSPGRVTDGQGRERNIFVSAVEMRTGDRLVLMSDGVTQAGMGRQNTPLGWGTDAAEEFLRRTIETDPTLSARRLARALVENAVRIDGGISRDDITCGVIHVRRPRRMLVVSGPPIDADRDRELALIADRFPGDKAVCGGTTSHILARELGRSVEMDISSIDPEIPNFANMDGFNIVTEGILTLTKAGRILEAGQPERGRSNAATRLVELFLENDIVEFLVGTRINEAHQDPKLPVEIEIRRNVIKNIARLLENKYMKKAIISYI